MADANEAGRIFGSSIRVRLWRRWLHYGYQSDRMTFWFPNARLVLPIYPCKSTQMTESRKSQTCQIQ